MTALTCPFCGLACDDLAVADGVVETRACPKAAAGFARITGARPHAIAGRPANLAEAVAAAAGILRAARLPVIAGLGADTAGIRALLALADRAGAVIDHRHSGAYLRNLAVVQTSGSVTASLSEVANRADFVLVVGADPAARYPRFHERLVGNAGALYRDGPAIRETLAVPDEALLDALAVLRALTAGRKPRAAVSGITTERLEELAARLAAARYGVVVWDAGSFPESIAELAVETLFAIVRQLNAKTRCIALPLGGDDNAQGAVQASLWQAGWPARLSFASGAPRYDRWANDARRLLASGEADALVWVAAIAPEPPPATQAPVIALLAGDVACATPPAVEIRVGCPAIDHAGNIARADGLVTLPLRAARPSAAPDVAAVAAAIVAELAGAAA